HPQSEEVQELLSKLLQDLQSINEELAEYINTPSWNFPSPSYDDDDDEYSFATQEYLMTCSTAITPDSPKTDSLIMVDKHLDTIPKIESDEFIKSSVENLVQNPSDVPKDEREFNPTHNEDLDSTPKDIRFDAESYLLESLANRDTLMASPPKIDFFLDDFAGELTAYSNHSPPGIDNINLDPEGDILFLRSLPISVDDLREEIDILHGPDDSIPSGIESDDFDSEDDDNSTSLPEFESFHAMRAAAPSYGFRLGIIHTHNDLESDLDVSSPSEDRNKIYDPGICIEVKSTRFLATLSPVIDTLIPFSSKNDDKVFNHGVLASKKKSPPFFQHIGP
ncbi:hypothetical protein Tco_0339170, partial [Tanacetum coccineum]